MRLRRLCTFLCIKSIIILATTDSKFGCKLPWEDPDEHLHFGDQIFTVRRTLFMDLLLSSVSVCCRLMQLPCYCTVLQFLTIHQSDCWILTILKLILLDGYYTKVRILPPVFDTALNLLPIHNLRPAKNEDINIVKDDLWHAYTIVMMQNVLSRSSLHWLT